MRNIIIHNNNHSDVHDSVSVVAGSSSRQQFLGLHCHNTYIVIIIKSTKMCIKNNMKYDNYIVFLWRDVHLEQNVVDCMCLLL